MRRGRRGRSRPSAGWTLLCALLVSSCAEVATNPESAAKGSSDTSGDTPGVEEDAPIPEPLAMAPFLVRGKRPTPQLATYTVTVTDVPIREVLFALARDAELNIDVYPGIEGNITLNAVNQTLPRILDRIAGQASLRYRLEGDDIIITPDLPYRRNYRVDYVATARGMTSDVAVSTQVATTSGSNSSGVNLKSASDVNFWGGLVENIEEIIGVPPDGEDKRVIVNKASGIINVMANSRGHAEVQAFLDRVMESARRQVVLEATVVEVLLDDKYQAGVDWSQIRGSTDISDEPLPSINTNLFDDSPISVTGILRGPDLKLTLRLLAKFGSTRVLSSPKITIINNQTAILRVSTNQVYFQTSVTPAQFDRDGRKTSDPMTEFQIRTVPEGFIMHVTPQVSDREVVTLTLRPTIQRISEWKENPDPELHKVAVTDPRAVQVPVLRVQEMDSVLRVPNGLVAVLGGLMENSFVQGNDSVPYLATLPVVGDLFRYRTREARKTELVIFLRPVVVREPVDLASTGDRRLFDGVNAEIRGDWLGSRGPGEEADSRSVPTEAPDRGGGVKVETLNP
ncbi:MAG: type II and III secretion system protein [Magnetococcales bacterium]|nr:type II and III secretion system protein [Magnetococcales bacterium]